MKHRGIFNNVVKIKQGMPIHSSWWRVLVFSYRILLYLSPMNNPKVRWSTSVTFVLIEVPLWDIEEWILFGGLSLISYSGLSKKKENVIKQDTQTFVRMHREEEKKIERVK